MIGRRAILIFPITGPTTASMSEMTLAGGPEASRPNKKALHAWLLRLVTGEHALGWADQILVSAMGFLTLVAIGSWSGISEVGIYAICVSVLALALASQDSLITRPYTIQMHGGQDAAGHAFGALALSLIFGAGSAFLLALLAAAMMFTGKFPQGQSAAWILAVSLPFVLLREFGRRFAFAQMRTGQALILDVVVVVINAGLLGGFAWSGRLSAGTAIASVGASCAAGSLGWLWLSRGSFSFGSQHLRTTARRSWGTGRWLFSAQMAIQIQGYTTHWMSMLVAGAAATGAYAACTSMVSFANPLLFGFINILVPKSARVFNAAGNSALRRQAARDALLLGALMGAFCVALAMFGETVMTALFPGTRGYGTVLTLLGLAAAAAAVGVPASIALASAECAHAVAAVTALGAAVNFGLVLWLLGAYGLTGAAAGVLIAEVLGSIGRWAAFLLLIPEPEQKPQHGVAEGQR